MNSPGFRTRSHENAIVPFYIVPSRKVDRLGAASTRGHFKLHRSVAKRQTIEKVRWNDTQLFLSVPMGTGN